ncbi:hypothetical protein CU098_003480 [Rhizopus stolonifer]|uniref:Uncharacterized protein n=1 Tax=Rhizopus stolonifer TaxID=4846 RepID=A0A367KPW4_RHIST|nr:hypothetical protein CU098_003480 [Rhizopus stolonifer]
MISQTPQRALSPPDTPTQPRHPSLLPSSRSSLRYMASVSSAGRTGSIISSGRMNYNDGPIVFNNSFNDFNTTNTTPSSSSPTAFANSAIPEEFEESIALQNKRISQILHNNPRMSQRSSYNRNSALSYATSTDDSHYDGDKRDSTSTTSSRARDSQPTQPQVATAVQVVQVTRAKPQIMRVNSVRQSVMSNGLSRSNSVRTILTPASESEINLPSPSSGTTDELNKKEKIVEEDEGEYDNVSIDQFPSTSDNPFNDTHASSSSAEDSTKKKH